MKYLIIIMERKLRIRIVHDFIRINYTLRYKRGFRHAHNHMHPVAATQTDLLK